MPKYDIEMTIKYAGIVDAADEDEARRMFIEDRETLYFQDSEDESIVQMEECDECGEEIEFDCVCEKEEMVDA